MLAMLLLVWLGLPLAQAGMFLVVGGLKFRFDATQRCYTVFYCTHGRSNKAEWEGLPDSSQIVCKGAFPFKNTALEDKVGSFMVREYSGTLSKVSRTSARKMKDSHSIQVTPAQVKALLETNPSELKQSTVRMYRLKLPRDTPALVPLPEFL
ncbi:hypothetical protein PHYPSEUDO_004747 [Phytophthora pseudosyringae]|uniref:Secreted protein n=1 Tax=Phytophthora pseudosyringae TaxID=221518 RepID=A0A8T1VQM8_9STRA|nr:hypothetical protein PHYPSEUDO_004747 [Phytophthora pseudosyringae]